MKQSGTTHQQALEPVKVAEDPGASSSIHQEDQADPSGLRALAKATVGSPAVNIKGQYLAINLTEASRTKILEAFPPKFECVRCEHVTLAYNLTPELLGNLGERYQDPVLRVVGYASDDSLECLVFSVNGSTEREDGSTFHLTLSREEGRSSADSNKVLRTATILPVEDFAVDGSTALNEK